MAAPSHPLRTREVASGIHTIAGLKMGRSYLVEDHDGIALVDTSSPSASDDIIGAIEGIGRRVEELRLIVATHYHYDHTGNAAALIERSDAQLCVHEADVPYVDGSARWRPTSGVFGFMDAMAPKPYALKVDRVLRDGDELPFADGLRVVDAPGHTPGHIALHAAARRVLFVGDALMNVGGLQVPPSMSSHDMEQAKHTIARLGELDYDVALPGHGAPIIGRANEKIAEWSRRWFR